MPARGFELLITGIYSTGDPDHSKTEYAYDAFQYNVKTT